MLRISQRARGAAVLLALALPLAVLPARAETRWYRVEVLAFSQYEGTREKPLRPAPRIPDNARTLTDDVESPATLGQLELMLPSAQVRDLAAEDDLARWIDALADRTHQLGTNGRLAEIAEWQPPPRRPPPNPAMPIDPVVAAEIAEAERLEREKKAKITQARLFPVTPAWSYRRLPAFALQLRGAAAKLAAKDGYAPLLHRAWLQPAKANERGEPVLLQGDVRDTRALVQLLGSDVPQLTVSVWRPAPAAAASAPNAAPTVAGASAAGGAAAAPGSSEAMPDNGLVNTKRLRASVRAASGKVFYLDGPGIGALVRVDLVNRDIADQVSGL